jgi:hypothetical protein
MVKMLQFFSSNAGLFTYCVLAVSSIILRLHGSVTTLVYVFVLSLAVLNTSIAMRYAGYWALASVYSIYTFSFTLLTLVLNDPMLSPFSSLITGMAFMVFVFIVMVIAQQFYSDSVYSLFSSLTPVAVLASIVLGIYIGLPNPLLFVAPAIVDAISSAIIISSEKKCLTGLAVCFLAFITVYAQPLLGFKLATLTPILLLHLARNLALALGKPLYASSALLLDIALRPVVWLL